MTARVQVLGGRVVSLSVICVADGVGGAVLREISVALPPLLVPSAADAPAAGSAAPDAAV